MFSSLFGTPEFKVGLLVLMASGLIATLALRSSEDPSYLGGSKDAWFLLDDASGLVKRSSVKMAGIDVGIIKDIQLQNGKARVQMVIKSDVPITRSARIEIRPNGILGDKFVEVVAGDPRDPPLRNGDQILIVDDRASMDRLIGEVSKITKSLGQVAENIRAATEGDTEKPLGKIISNLEKITTDVAQLTNEHKGQLGEIIDNIHEATANINEMISEEGPDGLKQRWKTALSRVDSSLKNIDEITGKINRGEGTIGKLVNDEQTVEQLNTAIEGVNGFLDTANKMQTSFDFHSEYLARDSQTKSYLSLNIQPGLDRYYEIGVVDDPQGVVETQQITTTSASGTSSITEDRRYSNKLKFNALFAKNFYNFTIKGGVMESAGGAGFDYHLLRKKLRFSVEAYDFANLQLKTYLRYSFFKGVYVIGGGHNLAGNNGNPSGFVGAGIFLTNDDLKLMLSRMPM